jgi:hypothetical protein
MLTRPSDASRKDIVSTPASKTGTSAKDYFFFTIEASLPMSRKADSYLDGFKVWGHAKKCSRM